MKSVTSSLAKEISNFIPQVADDLYTLRTYSKDLWPRNLIQSREERLESSPIDLVVWPENIKKLSQLVKYANEKNWILYPYGAGSGVCGGATAEPRGLSPQIVVDLKKMDKIEALDPISQTAKVQAGMIGQVLEEDLNARGFTLGHFPSSIYCSSFGGYLATRAAGQLSTYYGKIEDMILALEGVLPTGEIFNTPLAPRMSIGPDFSQFFLGSEGVFSFLTSAWVKIHRLPEQRSFLSFDVPSTEKALEGVMHWIQSGLRPAVVRIYDEDESRMLHGLKSGVRLLAIVEGERRLTEFTAKTLAETSRQYFRWVELGEEYAQHWWSHRYDVSYMQQKILSHRHMILDTFEVSTTWDRLPSLHKIVKQVSKHFEGEGMLVILAHFSHFYHCGGNIYFTLCGRSKEEKTVEFYDKVWDELLNVCEKQGAAISHHHGLGRLKVKSFMKQRGVLFDVLKKIKNELDPKHILNPKNLGL